MRTSQRPALFHLAFLGVLILVSSCAPPSDEAAVLPEESDDWVIGDPAEAGFAAAALEQLAVDIEAGAFPNTHAVLIEHDGALVFERYFSGSDEKGREFVDSQVMGADSLHDLRSISKSVTSALLGIALATDFETAIDRPVAEYLPGLTLGEAQQTITLHQVLTMTAGLQWNEMTVPYTDPMSDEMRLYSAADPALYVMTRSVERPPGSTWYYSGGLTQVLATVIFNITGQHLDEYARERLFGPLGITHFEWLGPGSWTPDNPAAMSGLRLRARDLAKIGSVYLHGGRWRSQQVVPESWVERSLIRHVAETDDWSDGGIWGYGYHWWIGALPSGERVLAGVGNGSQRLFILPDQRLVVTILASGYNRFEGHSERILDRVLAARGGSFGVAPYASGPYKPLISSS